MRAEFTAVYEPHPNGVYVGYVAEVPEVTTGDNTLEEARSNLAMGLRFYLQGERN